MRKDSGIKSRAPVIECPDAESPVGNSRCRVSRKEIYMKTANTSKIWIPRRSFVICAGPALGVAITGIAFEQQDQPDWKWCSKCQGLAYTGGGSGSCAAGASHDHSESGNYVLRHSTGNLRARSTEQGGWKWCNKCQGLIFGGSASVGRCAAGGEHRLSESGNYVLRHSTGNLRARSTEQEGWKWCNKCQGLIFGGSASVGRCAVGGEHSLSESGNYVLTHQAR